MCAPLTDFGSATDSARTVNGFGGRPTRNFGSIVTVKPVSWLPLVLCPSMCGVTGTLSRRESANRTSSLGYARPAASRSKAIAAVEEKIAPPIPSPVSGSKYSQNPHGFEIPVPRERGGGLSLHPLIGPRVASVRPSR